MDYGDHLSKLHWLVKRHDVPYNSILEVDLHLCIFRVETTKLSAHTFNP